MILVRRRDHAAWNARPGEEACLLILLIEGAPFPSDGTAGNVLAEAAGGELAELRRGRYTLLHGISAGASW